MRPRQFILRCFACINLLYIFLHGTSVVRNICILYHGNGFLLSTRFRVNMGTGKEGWIKTLVFFSYKWGRWGEGRDNIENSLSDLISNN